MNASELCTREVVFTQPGHTVYHAAELMRRFDVGDVVVIQEEGNFRRPVGMLTDRDIAVRVVAQGFDPRKLDVDEVMGQDIVTVHESMSINQVGRKMYAHGVRRTPVVDDHDNLVGIISIDDLVDLLSEELSTLAGLLKRQQRSRRQPIHRR